MHGWSLAAAAFACGTGIWAAILWWRASNIPVVPTYDVEPGEATVALQAWVAGVLQSASLSGAKNAKAAIWSGVSVGLSGIATLLGAFNL